MIKHYKACYIQRLRLGSDIETLDKGTLVIFGVRLVTNDFPRIVNGHKSIRGDHVPSAQVHLETCTESTLVHKADFNFWRTAPKRYETTDTKLEEGKGTFLAFAHDEDA